MMPVLKLCGAALCALAAVLVLRSSKSELHGLVGSAAAVMLFGAACGMLVPIVDFVKEISSGGGFEGYMTVLLKALGISLSVQFAAEICRDLGESSLASKLELIGKAEILTLSFPLIKELIALASELVSV